MGNILKHGLGNCIALSVVCREGFSLVKSARLKLHSLNTF